jgi:hypothetical protein
MTHTVVDNFLPSDYFENLVSLVSNNDFHWFFSGTIADKTDNSDCYFAHTVYINHRINSNLFDHLQPLLQKINVKALLRIRVLQYIKQNEITEHKPHVDFIFPHQAFILYLNTNDGFTRLDNGVRVESVQNRALFFDGSTNHNSTNCTSSNRRLVLTVNYF